MLLPETICVSKKFQTRMRSRNSVRYCLGDLAPKVTKQFTAQQRSEAENLNSLTTILFRQLRFLFCFIGVLAGAVTRICFSGSRIQLIEDGL